MNIKTSIVVKLECGHASIEQPLCIDIDLLNKQRKILTKELEMFLKHNKPDKKSKAIDGIVHLLDAISDAHYHHAKTMKSTHKSKARN